MQKVTKYHLQVKFTCFAEIYVISAENILLNRPTCLDYIRCSKTHRHFRNTTETALLGPLSGDAVISSSIGIATALNRGG